MLTLGYFIALEKMEGEDPYAQSVRQRLPHPADYGDAPCTAFRLPAPRPLYDSDLTDPDPGWLHSESVTFQRVKIVFPGVVFWAWKCLKDGKIYF